MNNLTDIRNNIEWGIYDKEIDEPTPLSKKIELVEEVKVQFYEDLLFRDVHLEIIDLAWEFSIDAMGGEEALNSAFLYSVLNNIERIEECINRVY